MGHATGTCEGRVSVALLGHFCHPLGFYLGFTVYSQVAEGPSFLEGSGDMAPWKFCEMNTHWDAICCILRHNFEKCCSLALNSSCLDDFSDNYSYLYSVMLTIFFGGKLGSLGGGGKAQPDNGQYHCTWPTRLQKAIRFTLQKFPYGTCLPNEFELLQSNHQIFVGTQWELACVESVFFLSWKLEVEKKERKL